MYIWGEKSKGEIANNSLGYLCGDDYKMDRAFPSRRVICGLSRMLKAERIRFKLLENIGKPRLDCTEVFLTSDFLFSPLKHQGDSGQLLIAKRKGRSTEKYLVKHEATDCACNEYVYYKLANWLNVPVPDVVLFKVAPDEKRKRFGTEYISGSRWINITNQCPTTEQLISNVEYLKIWSRCKALEIMFSESDGIELVIDDCGRLYRVDLQASFNICFHWLDYLGVDIEIQGCNVHQLYQKQLEDLLNEWRRKNIMHELELALKSLNQVSGRNCDSWFWEPVFQIQDIESGYVDSFLNVLCYFYPDCVGDYYREYIKILQEKSDKFLKYKL